MMVWALKSLVHDRAAFVAAILATAGAFSLVFMFQAVYVGESRQVVAYVDGVDAEIWVTQRGVSNMHMATSYLSADTLRSLRSMGEVATAEPILYLNTVVSATDYQWFAYVVGLDQDSTLARPRRVTTGRALPETDEVIVPRLLAEQAHLKLGDTLRIAGRDFTLAGLTEGTFSMANSVLFVSRQTLAELLGVYDVVSYILVKTGPGVDPQWLARRLPERLPVSAYSRAQFVENDRTLALQMGVETVALMALLSGALAAVLVAFTLYTQILRQRTALAAAKALGANRRQIILAVTLQAVVLTLSGVVVAALATSASMPLITAAAPQIQLAFSGSALAGTATLGLGVAVIASWWPMRQLLRIDPARALNP